MWAITNDGETVDEKRLNIIARLNTIMQGCFVLRAIVLSKTEYGELQAEATAAAHTPAAFKGITLLIEP